MVSRMVRSQTELDAKEKNWNISDATKERGNTFNIRDSEMMG